MTSDSPVRDIDALVRSLAPPFAFCGIGLARAAFWPSFHIATAPGIRATETTLFRAASISKIVTARTLELVAADRGGLGAVLDHDLADLLDVPLRHPRHPRTPITLRMVLTHTAAFDDAAGYLVPAGVGLPEWLAADVDTLFLPHAPGEAFSYSNLGYVMVAAATEAIARDRFDHLAQRLVLAPLGIAGGFNWSGVEGADRLPTYRHDGTGFVAQIDGPGEAARIADPYRPVRDTPTLSPQGGLRLSLAGMLTLARSLGTRDHRVLWAGDAGGLFQGYGAGLQILAAPDFYPRPLVGHFASAYGFCGGVWWDAARRTAFCYALNGLPLGDEDDGLRPDERRIFAAIDARISAG